MYQIRKMNLVDQILLGLVVLFGKEHIDFEYYVRCEIYWRKWAWFNRN